jgi:tRNA pseudouridine13 synthase
MPTRSDPESRARACGLLPGYVTPDLEGIGGTQRAAWEDFIVEEIPLYEPTGWGQHTLFEIEKRGISTPEAIARLAHALGVPRRRIASAGLKDAQAISRQRLSVEGISPQAVLGVECSQVQVLWAERHRNRLKIGHLRGNRFVIRLRDTGAEHLLQAQTILSALEKRGVPNGFGYQRFGARQTSHLLGQAIVRGDLDRFFHVYLGAPQPDDPEEMRLARGHFDEGDWAAALARWEPRSSDEYRALSILAGGHKPEHAFQRVSLTIRRILVSAYQSALFNRLLDERLDHLGLLKLGDLAVKHDNGAYFLVEDPSQEQPRADRLEISPSAPLYGYKVRLASGPPGERERALLAGEGLSLEAFRLGGGLSMRGERRALRAPLFEAQVGYEDGIVLSFSLPPGAYASNVIAEVSKDPKPRPDNVRSSEVSDSAPHAASR